MEQGALRRGLREPARRRGRRVEVEFKKPIFLPGSVAFGSRVVEFDTTHGLDFSLTNPGNGAPHLVGRARTA